MIEIDLVKIQSTDVGQQSSVVTFQLLGFGSSNNDQQAETVPRVESVQPIGFAVRPVPTNTTEALVIRRGDEVIALFALDKGQQNGSSPALADIVQGETRMYGAQTPSAKISIAPDGTINITAASSKPVNVTSGSGADIVLNGGTLKVARGSDPVHVCSLAATAGPYPVLFTVTPKNADGTPGAPVGPATPAVIEAVIATDTGLAPHVKS